MSSVFFSFFEREDKVVGDRYCKGTAAAAAASQEMFWIQEKNTEDVSK